MTTLNKYGGNGSWAGSPVEMETRAPCKPAANSCWRAIADLLFVGVEHVDVQPRSPGQFVRQTPVAAAQHEAVTRLVRPRRRDPVGDAATGFRQGGLGERIGSLRFLHFDDCLRRRARLVAPHAAVDRADEQPPVRHGQTADTACRPVAPQDTSVGGVDGVHGVLAAGIQDAAGQDHRFGGGQRRHPAALGGKSGEHLRRPAAATAPSRLDST